MNESLEEFERDLRKRSIEALGFNPVTIDEAPISPEFAEQIEQNQIRDEIKELDNFPDGPNEGSVFDDVKKPYWYEYRGGKWIKRERS